MNQKIIFILWLLSMSGLFQLSRAQGLEVSPVRLDFSLQEGKREAQTLTVRNRSSVKSVFTISVADWTLNEQGKMVRMDAGTHPNSCSKQVSFQPSMLELEPGNAQEVVVTMNVPKGDSLSRWSVIYVTLKKEQEGAKEGEELAMGIEVRQAIGVFVTRSSPDLHNHAAKMLAFEPLMSEEGEPEKGKYRVLIENTGATILNCELSCSISSLVDAKESTQNPVRFKILPEGKREEVLSLPEGLPSGPYIVAAILDIGLNSGELVEQLIVEIP